MGTMGEDGLRESDESMPPSNHFTDLLNPQVLGASIVSCHNPKS